MKMKLARCLRKWADLIDPRVKPTTDAGELVVTVRIDGKEEFDAQAEDIKRKFEALIVLGEQLKGLAS